jgi:poly-beta-hydroxyalkanoate depolymerase
MGAAGAHPAEMIMMNIERDHNAFISESSVGHYNVFSRALKA